MNEVVRHHHHEMVRLGLHLKVAAFSFMESPGYATKKRGRVFAAAQSLIYSYAVYDDASRPYGHAVKTTYLQRHGIGWFFSSNGYILSLLSQQKYRQNTVTR